MRCALIALLCAISAAGAGGAMGGAQGPAPPVIGAPSIEVQVREVLRLLPPTETAPIAAITFVGSGALVNIGACAETYVQNGRIAISTEPRCLVWIVPIVLHEIGHLQPECAYLAWAHQAAESETCAERYRRSRQQVWD